MSRRSRAQRISRSDLVRDSRSALIQAGVGDHTRARFIRLVSSEVVGSRHPLYAQLQPHVIPHRGNRAWDRAYAMIFQYLTEHGLDVTLETTSVETNQAPPKSFASDSTADEQFDELMEFAPPKSTVAERIAKSRKPNSAAKRGPSPEQQHVPKRSFATSEVAANVEAAKKTATGSSKKKPLQKRSTGRPQDSPPRTVASPGSRKGRIDETETNDFIVEDIKGRANKR
jgi:hypothetical protein